MYYLSTNLEYSGFFLFDWLKMLLGMILNGIYICFSSMGIENAAICIIVFTILVRSLMIPLSIKQQKFSKMSSIITPEVQAIQAKYKNKKGGSSQDDYTKMNREITAVYEKYGTSPTGGCLTSLITLPIMLALYNVIYNIPDHIPAIREIYLDVAKSIMGSGNKEYGDVLKELAKNAINKTTYKAGNGEDGIINVLKNISANQWSDLAKNFSDNPETYKVIKESSEKINGINSFVGGLNIMNKPTDKALGLIIPILAVLTQWYSMKQIQINPNDKNAKDNPAMQSMILMTKIMPVFSGIICLALPIGVGIYWITGSVFQIIQQFLVGKHMNKLDVNDLIKSNVEKANKRKEAREKSAFWGKIMQMQSESQELQKDGSSSKPMSISDYAKLKSKSIEEKTSDKVIVDENIGFSEDVKAKTGSISSYANILSSKK